MIQYLFCFGVFFVADIELILDTNIKASLRAAQTVIVLKDCYASTLHMQLLQSESRCVWSYDN